MRVTASDGVELEVELVGDGPAVLWLSGGPGLDNYLPPVARDVHGFRHVLPDARGTGRSGGGSHGLAVAIQDLEDLRRELTIERWIVLGHSWGADLALAYGLTCPAALTSIVSFAGTGVQNDRSWHAAYEARLHEEPHGAYRYSPEVHDELLADWRRFIQTPDLLARIATLSVPVTFVHAARDIRPGWPAAQLAQLVPHGCFLELADAPHEAWLTHGPSLVALLSEVLHESGGWAGTSARTVAPGAAPHQGC